MANKKAAPAADNIPFSKPFVLPDEFQGRELSDEGLTELKRQARVKEVSDIFRQQELDKRRLAQKETDAQTRAELYVDHEMGLSPCTDTECRQHHPAPRIRSMNEIQIDDGGPLLIERYHPTNHTIVYGPGGVGKGTLLANDLIKIARLGLRPVVADYEHHPEEWMPRIKSLGGGDVMGSIGYWPPPVGPIWEHVDKLHDMLADFRANVLVVDSIVFACPGQDTSSGDPSASINYQAAVSQFGIPIISLGHVTKENRNPEYPFGSVFWHNAPRLTYSFEFKAQNRLLVHRKTNNYAKRPAMLIETIFQEHADGLLIPLNVYERPYRQALIDLALPYIDGPMTTTEVLEKINASLDEDDKPHGAESLNKALHRNATGKTPQIVLVGKGGKANKDNVWDAARGEESVR